MGSKYRAKKTEIDGIRFDSQKEAFRYHELKLLEKAGEISDLQLQKEFVLIPQQKIDGKVAERKCSYFADFVYKDKEGKMVVEDTKGVRTPDYIIKRKLMLFKYKIKVVEV